MRIRDLAAFGIVHRKWVLPGAWAATTAILVAGATGAGFDPAALPWIAGVLSVFVAGAMAGLVAVLQGRRAGWCGLLGWTILPILHNWAASTVDEGWAPTFFADIAGILLGLGLAAVAIGASLRPPRTPSFWLDIEGGRVPRSPTVDQRGSPSIG